MQDDLLADIDGVTGTGNNSIHRRDSYQIKIKKEKIMSKEQAIRFMLLTERDEELKKSCA